MSILNTKSNSMISSVSVLMLCLLLGSQALFHSPSAAAEELEVSTQRTARPVIQTAQSAQNSKNPLRVRMISEFMTPPLSYRIGAVPGPIGDSVNPVNLYNIFWTDYEIADNLRLLYWQRSMISLASEPGQTLVSAELRDPRFALRTMHQFLDSKLNLTLDGYVQLPITSGSRKANKIADLGFRTSSVYTPSDSRLTAGLVTDFTGYFYGTGGNGFNMVGVVAPFVEYTLSDRFNTEHWLVLTFVHDRNTPWSETRWDTRAPYANFAPYMQNGVSWNISDKVAVSALLNNYLTSLPSIHNSWISLWLSLIFI